MYMSHFKSALKGWGTDSSGSEGCTIRNVKGGLPGEACYFIYLFIYFNFFFFTASRMTRIIFFNLRNLARFF